MSEEVTKIISKDEPTINKNKFINKQKKEALLNHLEAVRKVILFVDTQLLKNRQERRAFWKDFIKSDKSRQAAIIALLNHFDSLEETTEVKNEKSEIVVENGSGVASSPTSGS